MTHLVTKAMDIGHGAEFGPFIDSLLDKIIMSAPEFSTRFLNGYLNGIFRIELRSYLSVF